MDEFIYVFNKLLPYFLIFPIFVIVLYIILALIYKTKINNDNISLFGLFINLNSIDVLLMSLLLVQLYFIVCSLFIMKFSIYSFIFILLPIILFGILSKDYFKIIINLLYSVFICVLLIFKDIFFSYVVEVDMLWYVVFIFIVLCLTILVLSLFMFLSNFNRIFKKKKNKSR